MFYKNTLISIFSKYILLYIILQFLY
jgi:hypothetical protein